MQLQFLRLAHLAADSLKQNRGPAIEVKSSRLKTNTTLHVDCPFARCYYAEFGLTPTNRDFAQQAIVFSFHSLLC